MEPAPSRALAATLVCCIGFTAPVRTDGDQFVDVDGRRMHVRTDGPDGDNGARPLVVFESGLGARLDYWSAVFTRVARTTRVLAYDRAGIGRSESDETMPTPAHVARKLHALLSQIGQKPPYILVGHSLGGPFIRMFAALYPSDVAGLVYVDPTDIRSEQDELALFRTLGYSAGEVAKRRDAMRQEVLPDGPYGAEMKVARDLASSYFADFRILPPAPDVPVSVLMAAKFEPAMWAGRPCQPRTCHDAWVRFRAAALKPLIHGESDDALTLTTGSGHGIPLEDPQLVAWAVRQVLTSVQRRVTWSHDGPK